MWQNILEGFATIGFLSTVGGIAFVWQQWKKANRSARRTVEKRQEAERPRDLLANIGAEGAWVTPQQPPR